MSSQFLTHISADGDRWDLLAWNYYGDATLFGPIVMANPAIPIEPVLAAGLTVVDSRVANCQRGLNQSTTVEASQSVARRSEYGSIRFHTCAFARVGPDLSRHQHHRRHLPDGSEH